MPCGIPILAVALGKDLIRFFENKFTFYQGDRTQILSYLIPGVNNVQQRRYWVWYVNVKQEKLKYLLTDDAVRPQMVFVNI
ncbi:hypothetical protein [Paenibacillus lutimineralis]|uniref:FAD binding domain-containing protein n=1 Tax=Paenibacillus lutimineralis TaxID=2707005 RepID=UPI003AB73A55